MTKKKQKGGKVMTQDLTRKSRQAPTATAMDDRALMDKVKDNPVMSVFFAVLGLLLILDFAVHKHEPVGIGNAPEFYAVYGFLSAVFLVFAAKGLRLLFTLKRK